MSREALPYDVGLSFAGEQRGYVTEVANELRSHGIRVFFDDYERAKLWGKDLYSHLAEIYCHMCRYCILFISTEYASKVWTNHERGSAQARALKENEEYILPARFDDTPIPGLHDTIYYVDLRQASPQELADLTLQKLGNPVRSDYLPPVLDRLFARLGIEDDIDEQECVESVARSFLESLRRMEHNERVVVLSLIRFGCPTHLPDNVHINADLLRRHTGKSISTMKRLLGGLRSLGFKCTIRESADEESISSGEVLGDSWFFDLEWVDLSGDDEVEELTVAYDMVAVATEYYCEEHGTEHLQRLDFSQLSSATFSRESDAGHAG